MIDPSQSVFIEYCHNCGQHSWCTKHDEARYYSMFTLIKAKIEEEFPGLTAYGNTHPAIGRPINPTLGAFEVTFNKHKIFSKLKTRTWPTTKQVLASIRSVLDGQSPTDAELVDYSAIPFGDKAKVSSAGLPSARRTFHSKTYLQVDYPSRSLSRNELETISSHSPGHVKTPRKIAASSLGRVDTTSNSTSRPGTSNYMPSLKSAFGRPPTTGNNNQMNYLTVNDFKNKPYYLQDGMRKSATDVEGEPGTLPEIKPSIVMGMATNNSYLNVSENPYEDAPSHRSFVDVPNLLVSPKVGSIANELGFFGQGDPEVDRPSRSEIPTNKRHIRSYSQEVTIKQTRDLENNEYTVFTQQKLQEERESAGNYRSLLDKKGFKRASWFPDCQRGNASPDRLIKGVNFEEKLKPFTNLRRPDSGKREPMPMPKEVPVKGKGNSAYSTMMTKTIANLKKLEFPEEKLSQIEVPKNKISKKKITMVPDGDRPCKMEVYCTIPGVVGPEFAGVSVPRGGTFKVPLKFEGKEVRDCWIYVLKDGRPWQKIIMDIYLV